MKVFRTSFLTCFLHVRYRRPVNLRTRLKLVQMWSVDIFSTSFKVNLDIIYTVSGPNKHSQDALNLNVISI